MLLQTRQTTNNILMTSHAPRSLSGSNAGLQGNEPANVALLCGSGAEYLTVGEAL